MFNIYFIKNRLSAWAAAAASALLFFAAVAPAFADDDVNVPTTTVATNFGELLCNAVSNTAPFGTMFQYGAWGIGAICALQGVHHVRLHTDRPSEKPLGHAMMLFFGSACLLTLPYFISMVISSLYGITGAGGLKACAAGAVGGGNTLDVILTSFVGNIYQPMQALCSIIAIVCGFAMIVRGLVKASKHGIDPRTHSAHAILTNIVFGALLMTIGENLSMIMNSVFGNIGTADSLGLADSTVINWNYAAQIAGGASAEFKAAVVAGLEFVQVIGLIAFVRGWLVMKKVVEGGGNVTMAQGITHIVGGVLAINVFGFLQIMNATFGTQLFN